MEGISLNGASMKCENNVLTLSGKGIAAKVLFPTDDCPSLRMDGIINEKTGYNWQGADRSELFNIVNGNSLKLSGIKFYESDNAGISDKYLVCRAEFDGDKADIAAEFTAYPDNGIFGLKLYAKKSDSVSEEDKRVNVRKTTADAVFSLSIPKKQYRMYGAETFDYSDINNTFVKEYKDYSYNSSSVAMRGHFFVAENYAENEALLIVREAPTRSSSQNVRSDSDFVLRAGAYIDVLNSGFTNEIPDEYLSCYGIKFGCADGDNAYDDLIREYRDHYRHINTGRPDDKLVIISNTWGDRNSGSNLNEEFMLREIEAANKLGVDAVQLDWGWDGESRLPKKDTFPNGFEKLNAKCAEYGIQLGVWTMPKMENEYENWSTDADALINIYKNLGCTQIKVDGVTLSTRKCEENLRKMFEKILRETQNKAQINNDITASKRFGFLYNIEYANLFVANRYTAWNNYYPHYTLRGMWQLSKYIPTRRFQTEFLNRKLFADKYKADDPFAPINYEMDYLFAISAFANPLVWLEMYNLDEEDSANLTKMISAYKPYQKALFNADVQPIGEEPDGVEFTGLDARTEDGGFLMLFCEMKTGSYTYNVPGIKSAEVIYRSEKIGDVDYSVGENTLSLNIKEPRSFVFMKYTK